MKPENKEFLEANYHHWDTLRKADFIRNLSGNERSDMQRVMGEEFQPGYATDLWCSPCVADMVRHLYTRYDQWKAENEKKTEPAELPIPPKADEPIIVQTGFPKQDPPADFTFPDDLDKIGPPAEPVPLKPIKPKKKR